MSKLKLKKPKCFNFIRKGAGNCEKKINLKIETKWAKLKKGKTPLRTTQNHHKRRKQLCIIYNLM